MPSLRKGSSRSCASRPGKGRAGGCQSGSGGCAGASGGAPPVRCRMRRSSASRRAGDKASGSISSCFNRSSSSLGAAGGTWYQEIRFAVLPQVIPNYLSYTFWRLELNVRSATIVGFVGAGGIGHDLFTSIQLLYFSDAGAILLIIVATIMLIDILSEKFRHSAIGKAAFAR